MHESRAFGVSAEKFLGFLVHHRGISVDPAKATAIATMKWPTIVKELKSFLGRVSYIKRTPKTIKSQAIIDLLAHFLGNEECPFSEEISEKVVVAKLPRKKWTIRFDASTATTSNGLGIVQSCEDGDTMPLSFKFGFSCSNNAAKYEAYLIGLAIVLSLEVKHMRVLEDSNLVISQVKGDFALRE
ncbi:uncharacterized protein LOC142625355 [Castanea sativa]|uniref:uncharacterized protein LOC142625355 n=1 Tax=Castanea sativa TaxID=21020 RepID=UPI003F65172B